MYYKVIVFFLLNLIVSPQLSIAQVTISKSNMELIFAANQQVYLYSDTSDTVFQVDIGQPGGPHTYDFSGVQFSQISTASTIPVGEVAQLASHYANDAIAFRFFEDEEANESEYFIYRLLENGLFSLGDAEISGSNARFEHLVPQEIVGPFPLNYGFDTTYTVTVIDTSFAEGLVVETSMSDINVSLSTNGWGTLILPGFGSFECLRHIELDLPPDDSKSFLFFTREGYLLAIETVNTEADSGLISVGSIDLFVSSSAVTGLKHNVEILQEITLLQNYPNPFNPSTTINYQLAMNSTVDLAVYNLLGQRVATLVSEKQAVGSYSVQWDASRLASGIYFYRLQTAQGFVKTKKLILLK